jgi:hypothetical protein
MQSAEGKPVGLACQLIAFRADYWVCFWEARAVFLDPKPVNSCVLVYVRPADSVNRAIGGFRLLPFQITNNIRGIPYRRHGCDAKLFPYLSRYTTRDDIQQVPEGCCMRARSRI